MMKLVRNGAVLACALGLAACSSTGDHKNPTGYESSVPAKKSTLEVPPDLMAPTADGRFAMPDSSRGSATLSTYSSRPAEAAAASPVRSSMTEVAAKMRIMRAGTQRWLVVPGTTTEWWTKTREFWLDSGFTLKSESPNTLVMETDWAENRANIPQDIVRSALSSVIGTLWSNSERDKFRTRLEPGQEPGTVEIYISHRGVDEVFIEESNTQTRWQSRPPDPNLEAEMLVNMMTRFAGVKKEEATQTVAAAAAAPSDRAQLGKDADGASQLLLKDPIDRAWRQVGLSLDRVGLVVEDRDRAKGYYVVRYVMPEDVERKDSGIMSKLAFWRDDKGNSITGEYRIAVAGDAAQSTVRVLNKEGVVVKTDSARQILSLLYEQLK
ncbi:outer membrane protein assembly factor BamC [Uliginosibacterium sp. H1]|uniref:outer membrane protein assembly factor BamC n=1 Tax=Uliginosibacterium sp. H1 TaxID=3114757 RepID=UPI002E17972A|nr:outer membrane protein assembly factor BamC [Uliginosibacterium sp. H1]